MLLASFSLLFFSTISAQYSNYNNYYDSHDNSAEYNYNRQYQNGNSRNQMNPVIRTTTRRPRTSTPDSMESAEYRGSYNNRNNFQTTAVGFRNKRQIYYLCGNFPNQYLSITPCNNNGCNNCNNCQYRCSSTSQCISIRANYQCIAGCCRAASQDPTTTQRPPSPSPLCGGRETSGGYCRAGNLCGSGYMCNDNNVCCRCSYGTSVGPCVNGQCPNNTYCSPTNNCCPYLVSK